MCKTWIEIVKECLTAEDIITHYVGKPRRNKVKCPFCGDGKTPSLHIYKDGNFKSFCCGEFGDGIGFVSKLFKCDTKTALEIIGKDFGLDFSKCEKSTAEEINRLKQARLKKQIENQIYKLSRMEMLDEIKHRMEMFRQIQKDNAPYSLKNLGCYRYKEEPTYYLWAVRNLNRLDWLYEAVAGFDTFSHNMDKQYNLEFWGRLGILDKFDCDKRSREIVKSWQENQINLVD